MQCAVLECRSGQDVHTLEHCQHEVQLVTGAPVALSIVHMRNGAFARLPVDREGRRWEVRSFARTRTRDREGKRKGRFASPLDDGLPSLCNVPFEFEGEVSCARAVAEARHVECSAATARTHACSRVCVVLEGMDNSEQ